MQYAVTVREAVLARSSADHLEALRSHAQGRHDLAQLHLVAATPEFCAQLVEELGRNAAAESALRAIKGEKLCNAQITDFVRMYDPRGASCDAGADLLAQVACFLRVAAIVTDACVHATAPNCAPAATRWGLELEMSVHVAARERMQRTAPALSENEISDDTAELILQDWYRALRPRPTLHESAQELLLLSVVLTRCACGENELVTAAWDRCRDLRARHELTVTLERRCSAVHDSCPHGPECGRGLREATRQRLEAPVPDDLYQMAMEYVLASREVPAAWGYDLPDAALRRDSVAFRRNPASNVAARVAPELAGSMRSRARTLVEKAHRAADDDLAWELGVIVFAYDCDQTARVDWARTYFLDAELHPMHALERLNRFRTNAPRHAPLIVHHRGRWYIHEARTISCARFPCAWCAMHEWCRVVREDLQGNPHCGADLTEHLQAL
ncbi:hypothetical protein CYMTET_52298 [Cymbomonas tetramitiformis]|uniref:Uncharacterized protein n=1 Tax=Cymbomonas tetramitiformis TaxID=36881 RepID=A0AAE0EQY0_9CHLO|nr:hypothetical protein CYMTET_52298 [Cymbomonas tetramitiformis]